MGSIALPANATPVAAKFAGQWYRRKGLPGIDAGGTPGTNGEPGGFRMNMSILTAEEKPGTGKIRFDYTDLSQATEMYIDEMLPSGVDLSGFWSILESGWYFILKPATNFNSLFAVIKITGILLTMAIGLLYRLLLFHCLTRRFPMVTSLYCSFLAVVAEVDL